MNLSERIKAFSDLGLFLSQLNDNKVNKTLQTKNNLNQNCFEALQMQIKRAYEYNGWFTKENILKALKNWSTALTEDNLKQWTKPYSFKENPPKTVAVIMAGNIPLVGFHDFLSVLISGNKIIVKQASNDSLLLPILVKFLEGYSAEFKNTITLVDSLKDKNFDAIIATGSNNTARYFEYYFSKYPHIIRKNRNSVAILTGKETEEELKELGNDIFQYFGLGCRSVSKLFVPKNYNFDLFFKAIYPFKDIINYKKYENNYDYNKAVYLMSLFKLTENGFLILKEDSSYSSPIATLFYEYYDDLDTLNQQLQDDSEKIQCIVSNEKIHKAISFGETQKPKLWDYADDVDTLDFLTKL